MPSKYVAAFLLSAILATDASAAEDLKFFIQKPVLQKMKFNGIEGRASFTITPPDTERPLTSQQKEILSQYGELENKCRGGSPGPTTDNACEERDKISIRKFGICLGLKTDQSMADMEYHACRVSSNEYEIGSESLSVTCRPGESVSISLGILAPQGLADVADGQAIVKFGKGELKGTYSVVRTALEYEDRASIDYDFGTSGVSLLRDLYDGNKVIFRTGSDSLSVALGSTNEALRDEIARAYSVCK